jgi:putative lipoic acid-binding regulatory protein
MRNLDDIEPEEPGQGFQFPGVFEITVMGQAGVGLESRVPQTLGGLGLNVLAGSQRERPSSQGHYVAVSVSFTCPDRATLERAHTALRADPDVRWTL